MDERACVEIQESSGEAPAHCWSKKKKRLDALKRTRAQSFTLSPFPRMAHLSGQEAILAHVFSHGGKGEHVSDVLL